MAYSFLEDIQALINDDLILQLADDSGLAALADEKVQSVINGAIQRADREIDAYVSAVKPVPLSPVPPLINNLSSKIAVYNLHRRRPHLDLGEWKDEYSRCLKLLERIAGGRVPLTPEGDEPEQAEAAAGVSVTTGRQRFESIWDEY
jgi:phage gp36-like protein